MEFLDGGCRQSSALLVTCCNGHDQASAASAGAQMIFASHLLPICLRAYSAYRAYIENGMPMQL